MERETPQRVIRYAPKGGTLIHGMAATESSASVFRPLCHLVQGHTFGAAHVLAEFDPDEVHARRVCPACAFQFKRIRFYESSEVS